MLSVNVAACTFCLLSFACSVSADPPLCTTWFFDWYAVSDEYTLADQQSRWTYQVDWGALGISLDEIGHTAHYYEVQFRKIREAGFDGIHFVWGNRVPTPRVVEAAATAGLPLAMFFDMQIRFGERGSYFTPTEAFAKDVVDDLLDFYGRIPRQQWLHDRNGKLPIIFYAFNVDDSITDPARWDTFYRSIIEGVESGLGKRVVFHWTNTGTPQQMYAFEHFPQIQSFADTEASRQTQANAHSVSFVVHYDDLGVSFARGGGRKSRWIRNDIRYLQEALWLARHTDPDLVSNYGWNELYEGEHLMPDAHWGTWRYELASAMLKAIKSQAKADLPRALIIADDFLPALHTAGPDKAAILLRQMRLLTRLRSFVPQAEVVLPGSGRDFSDYRIIFSLNTAKVDREEAQLANTAAQVVYLNPSIEASGPVIDRFTSQPRRPVRKPTAGPIYAERGPTNEYVRATRNVDVDLTRFPVLAFRCRNLDGALFNIRCFAENEAGEQVPAWHETGPTDDLNTKGEWLEQRVNIVEVAGRPVRRLTRIELILDDSSRNGRFTLDVDYLRMTDEAGRTGWRDEFDAVADWSVGPNFGHLPGGASRFSFSPAASGDTRYGRMTLTAVSSNALPDLGPIDEATRHIQPRSDVRVLFAADFRGRRIPILVQQENCYHLNTYSVPEDCWSAFLPQVLGREIHRTVMFGPTAHTVRPDGVTSATHEQWGIMPPQPLPIDRIRLVAPPELDRALPHVLPADWQHMKLRIIAGRRTAITWPDPGSDPPTITLLPGEIVELIAPE